jgi:hypothetical protein
MRHLSLISTLVLALTTSCVQDTNDSNDTDDNTAESSAAESSARPGDGGATLTCDDLDTYCGSDRPCGEGFVCTLDTDHCGANFFGTFPNCGVTATCLPTCQPK